MDTFLLQSRYLFLQKAVFAMGAPVLFLYNLDTPRGSRLRRMCLPLGIRTKLVPPQAHTLTLEDLTGGAPPPEDGDPGFSEEMLLLAGFTSAQVDALLQGFRRAKLPPVPLKAVLTPTNLKWTSVQLRDELLREHQAMTQGRAPEHARDGE